ncbi:LuxR C-terminal-related transcriptional regulator [Kitasatospora sp. NPDC028055]|uniref:LuxR C-terminal-related transcriptional regulator n=1 Tax=Kitasatospora sp. NPDC028055 TaxID=3155653 RepID=UPI0033C535A4
MTDEPGPAERALYLAVVRAGGRLRPEDLAPADRATVAALVARGLLTPTATGYTAANPRALGDRLGTELRLRAVRLLVHAERLPGTLQPLSRAYEALHRPSGGVDGARLDCARLDGARPDGVGVDVGAGGGAAAVRQCISELLAECKEEFLAARPGHHSAEVLQTSLAQDLALLRRGCSMRTLHQPGALADPATLRQVALRSGEGAEARALAEPYERMLVFDRSVAVIPAVEDRSRATVVTDRTTVAYLVAQFERDWARATPADRNLGAPHPTTVRIGRLLARGLTQRAVATRLGLSERTVAAHISRLRERYGAQTLFHLGWHLRGERHG